MFLMANGFIRRLLIPKALWKLPSPLELLSNGGPLFSCSWTLDHLSSKLGFDGIADFINDEGDGVWSNSEVVGQAWIIVTVGQVS